MSNIYNQTQTTMSKIIAVTQEKTTVYFIAVLAQASDRIWVILRTHNSFVKKSFGVGGPCVLYGLLVTNNNNNNNRFIALCLVLPGLAGTKRNIQPLTTILINNHPLSASSIYYEP